MDELDLGQTIRGFTAGQKILNRYTFVRILGRGGMGVVWLARDDELEREVALKFLPELVVHDRAVLEELKHETRRSLALTHHNIVRIYDFAQDAECACISMEYVDGATLSSLRVDRPDKVFEVEELGPLLQQVCDALQYAHAQARIVHRDLKPSNLMVNAKGDVKVTDFGIARSLTDSVSMLTMARGTSGTLVYMSPQQLDGERVSELDDIYSLGATIYELLTGKPPFYSGQIDRLVREKIPPSIAARRADLGITSRAAIPPHWEEAVASCLAKDPAVRPRSAAELRERLLSPTKTYAPPPMPPPPMAPPPIAPPQVLGAPMPPMPPGSATPATGKTDAAPTEVSWIRQHPGMVVSAIGATVILIAVIVWLGARTTTEVITTVQPQVTPAPSIVPYSQPPTPVATIAASTPEPTAAPSSSAPVFVPPPPPPSTTSRVEIEGLVAKHLKAVSGNDPATVASLYGDQVDFLTEGIKSHETLAREITEYFARWPVQNFRRTSEITIDDVDSNTKTVSFSMEFDARSTAGKTSAGAVVVTWMVRRPSLTSEFKIVSQKQKTINRTTLNPTEQPPATAATEQIKQFVIEHFRKTERSDCDGALSDYASHVDYFDNGAVGKDFISRDCSAYVKAWPEITLNLTGTIDVRESGNGEYAVVFGYDFDARNKAKGKISRGHAADTWRVENRLGGYKITYHRETITNRSTR
jgi:serine/threonine protein kinase